MNEKFAVPNKMKIHVRYAWRKFHKSGLLLDEADNWSENVLTDHGRNQFLSIINNGSVNVGCCIGSGAGTPSRSTPRLSSFVTGTSTQQTAQFLFTKNFATPPYSLVTRRVFRFGSGVPGAPLNITEFGFALDTTSPSNTTNLFSVAKIVDGGGNPVSISLLADEYLDVVTEFTLAIADEVTGTMPVDVRGTPSSFNYVMIPASTDVQTSEGGGWIQQTTIWFMTPTFQTYTSKNRSWYASGVTGLTRFGANPLVGGSSAASDRFDSVSIAGYTSGSFYRDGTYKMSLNQGVRNGVNGFRFSVSADNWEGFGVLGLRWPNDSLNKLNTDLFEITIRHVVDG